MISNKKIYKNKLKEWVHTTRNLIHTEITDIFLSGEHDSKLDKVKILEGQLTILDTVISICENRGRY